MLENDLSVWLADAERPWVLRFLALRWSRVSAEGQWDTLSVPLLIELRDYHRWDCRNGKSL